MITFRCSHCSSGVFFENLQCLNCGHALGYLPAENRMVVIESTPGFAWASCAHRFDGLDCNWLVPAGLSGAQCDSCRFTRTVAPLDDPRNLRAWARLEVAKRRLFYSLFRLKLPLPSRSEQAVSPLAFDFLTDVGLQTAVMTGHDRGVITISVAEADDVLREQSRVAMHEPYRTLLGHLRHEIGHFYWDQLVARTRLLVPFRRLFGDERVDYMAALQRHYQSVDDGAWHSTHISRYATAHPWEDWAETWAHYLHIGDALETAADAQLRLRSAGRLVKPRALTCQRSRMRLRTQLIAEWLPLSQLLNNASRSMGEPDVYPFTLPDPVIEKLNLVHRVICGASRRALRSS